MQEITKWLYLEDLDHWIVREWVNGIWFALSFCVVAVFGTRLIKTWRREPFHEWYRDIGTRATIAIFFYFLGETFMRGWVWLLIFSRNINSELAERVQDDYLVAIMAATLSTWASLCCIYIFSRSHWAWIWSAAFIASFIAFETYVLFRF